MTSAQVGYAISPPCLSVDECDTIIQALADATVARSRAGARHLMSNPVVATLAKSDHLISLACEWLGGTAVPFRATLFEKSQETNWLIPWHQDTALPLTERFLGDGWGPWSEKAGVNYAHAPSWALDRIIALRVHLDSSNMNNGPLRVVPGSHKGGVLTDAQVSAEVSVRQEVACVVERGGIIAMRPLLIHCSSKAVSDDHRRVLHIEYAGSLDLDDRIRLAVV